MPLMPSTNLLTTTVLFSGGAPIHISSRSITFIAQTVFRVRI